MYIDSSLKNYLMALSMVEVKRSMTEEQLSKLTESEKASLKQYEEIVREIPSRVKSQFLAQLCKVHGLTPEERDIIDTAAKKASTLFESQLDLIIGQPKINKKDLN
jgi:hypothetical protein